MGGGLSIYLRREVVLVGCKLDLRLEKFVLIGANNSELAYFAKSFSF